MEADSAETAWEASVPLTATAREAQGETVREARADSAETVTAAVPRVAREAREDAPWIFRLRPL